METLPQLDLQYGLSTTGTELDYLNLPTEEFLPESTILGFAPGQSVTVQNIDINSLTIQSNAGAEELHYG